MVINEAHYNMSNENKNKIFQLYHKFDHLMMSTTHRTKLTAETICFAIILVL